jgi:hypothetical protein
MNDNKLYAEQLAEYLKIIQKPKLKSKKAKKLNETVQTLYEKCKEIYPEMSAAEAEYHAKTVAASLDSPKKPNMTVKAMYGLFGVPAEYLDGKEMKPMKLEKGVLQKKFTKKHQKKWDNIGKNNQAFKQYLITKEEEELALKQGKAQALAVKSIAKAFGVPPEYLVGTQQAPLIDAVTSTAYATPVMLPKGTPSGSAGTTDFGGWGVSSTNSPVSEWKKYAALVANQEKQLLMDSTVIALQTKIIELEQKLAKKELQESDLKEPKKRKRIVEI